MTNAGIDYSLGKANRDTKTGIHYGVISQHSVMEAWVEESQPDYGKPTCPKCGSAAKESGKLDFYCSACRYHFLSEEAYPDEPGGYYVDKDGYQMVNCLDSDIMIIKSPYYTFARFCSPCVPGAGNLNDWNEQGIKTYCPGHDWFEGGAAPYPVYRVATGLRMLPPRTDR